ncbi:MAG TPA: hypothetical protein VJH87_13305, partial [Vicinamibacteria bacterium]|nr:hypothetical protein [Vicinamibacteria bacterium]
TTACSGAPLHRELHPEGDLSRRRGWSRRKTPRLSGRITVRRLHPRLRSRRRHRDLRGPRTPPPGHRGAVVRSTFEAARLKGYEKFFTFIRADNPAALATYRRHGFKVIGTARRQARMKHGYVDEILVEAFL